MPAFPPRLGSAPSLLAALTGAGDPESSRVVYAMVIGLAVVGVVLLLLGIWIIRQTRGDLEVLAPLERMGDGDWKKRDRSTQRRMLDEVRPEGATPLTPSTQPPSLDEEFEQEHHPVTSFSDLGPGVASEQRDPTPAGRTDDLWLGLDADSEIDDAPRVDAPLDDEAEGAVAESSEQSEQSEQTEPSEQVDVADAVDAAAEVDAIEADTAGAPDEVDAAVEVDDTALDDEAMSDPSR